jgi:hypothetical protein
MSCPPEDGKGTSVMVFVQEGGVLYGHTIYTIQGRDPMWIKEE